MLEDTDEISSVVPLGLTRDGEEYCWDLERNTTLIALGPTASGKTVFLRNILIRTTLSRGWLTYLLDGKTIASPAYDFTDQMNVERHAVWKRDALLDVILYIREEVEKRLGSGHSGKMMLLIDDIELILSTLNEDTQTFMSHLLFIMKYGHPTGVHVAMTIESFPSEPQIRSVLLVPGFRILLGASSEDAKFILFDGFTDYTRPLPEGRFIAKKGSDYTEFQGYSYDLSEAEVYLRAQD